MANSPLQPIKTSGAGFITNRVAQLEGGAGNNQQARASDVNPAINWINDRSGVNQTSVTTSTLAGTLNTKVGSVTTDALTTAAGDIETVTITNSFVATTSIVLVELTDYSGTLQTDGYPMLLQVTPGSGSFVVKIVNADADGASAPLDGTVTFKFIVL